VKQEPFTLGELTQLSKFLNEFCFQMIWNFDGESHLLERARRLLMVLYDRNSIRSFTPEGHWIIPNPLGNKFQTFVLSDSFKTQKESALNEKALRLLKLIPHSVPFKTRLSLFQKTLEKDKSELALNFLFHFLAFLPHLLTSPRSARKREEDWILVTIRRKYILEDGIEQLSKLPPKDFRKTIKVRFLNEQGLYEAGIDQMGVFKEVCLLSKKKKKKKGGQKKSTYILFSFSF